MIKPLADRVLVKEREWRNYKSGIILASSAQEKSTNSRSYRSRTWKINRWKKRRDGSKKRR